MTLYVILLCLVPYRYTCICIFFIREVLVLDCTKLIGVSEPNLGSKVSFGKKGIGGGKVFKTFGIGGCAGQM